MDRCRLFVETIRDLENRVQDGSDEYSLLMAAALLRKLLMDGQPLVHAVNREFGLKVEFEVNMALPDGLDHSGQELYLWVSGIDPQKGEKENYDFCMVNLSGLLVRPMIDQSDARITVRDIIDEASHVIGAVHAGKDSELSEPIRSWDHSLKLNGYTPAIGLLQGIGRVVVRGCQPLVQAIEEAERES